MNCKGCGKGIDWMNWGGLCFGCHMHGADRLKPKPVKVVPVSVTPAKPVVLDLFAEPAE